VPVVIDDAWLERIRSEMGELPAAQIQRLQTQYGLSAYDADVLVRQGRKLVAYFETVAQLSQDAKAACNWITNKLLRIVDGPNQISAERLASLMQEQKVMGLTKQIAEEVFDTMLAEHVDAKTAINKLGITAIDESQLVAIVRQAIADNPKAVEDYRAGKTAAVQRIKGAVMKATKGAVKPDVVDRLLTEELGKND
jgi:aspartyl-tRNA(Asn)/glutamyl-tRNA(Gln) amidotransferase subunit B